MGVLVTGDEGMVIGKVVTLAHQTEGYCTNKIVSGWWGSLYVIKRGYTVKKELILNDISAILIGYYAIA